MPGDGRRLLGLVLALSAMTACAGEESEPRAAGGRGSSAGGGGAIDAGGGGGEADAGTRPAPAGRARVDQRLPAIAVEPLGHAESLLKAHAWTVVVLVPIACETCPGEASAWVQEAEIWTATSALRAVIVAEGRPEALEWLVAATAGSGIQPFHTRAPMFRFTGELSRPSFVLVDTMGVVRFVGRQSGTIEEKWRSLGRSHAYQSASDEVRREILGRALSFADSIELRRTTETPELGEEVLRLGLSPWYGVALRANGERIGYGLPIERDTDCNTCDPLYLVVGIANGRVMAIEEIEPVVSLGERETTGPFFEALLRSGSDHDVALVKQMLVSAKADRATREILSLAFTVWKRLEGDR